MPVYKISYVVIGDDYPGSIVNQDHMPTSGEIVTLGDRQFRVLEVLELVPPRGDFHYIHVTCKPEP